MIPNHILRSKFHYQNNRKKKKKEKKKQRESDRAYCKFPGKDICYQKLFQFLLPNAHCGDAYQNSTTTFSQ